MVYAEKELPAQYLFMQGDAAGYSVAHLNCVRLAKLLKKSADPESSHVYSAIPSQSWLTWQQTVVLPYQAIALWHAGLRSASVKKTPTLYNFLQDAGSVMPVAPHLVVAEDGVSYFSSLQRKIALAYFPSFLIDEKAARGVMPHEVSNTSGQLPGLALPLFQLQDGSFVAYVRGGREQELLACSKQQAITPNESGIYMLSIDELQTWDHRPFDSALLGLHAGSMVEFYPVAQGSVAFQARSCEQEFCLFSKQQDRLTLSQLGVYKLLLLHRGFDTHHDSISTGHPLWQLTADVREVMNVRNRSDGACVVNQWHQELMHEVPLELAIASLFKEDPILFEKVEQLVDFGVWAPYAAYNELLQLCHGLKNSLTGQPLRKDELMRYLPGAEQMLAYCMVMQVCNLWYAALNEEAFYRQTIRPVKDLVTMAVWAYQNWTLHIPEWSFKVFAKAAYKKQQIHGAACSFIQLWQEVVSRIKLKYPGKEHFMYCAAGSGVITFNQHLIAAQRDTLGMHEHLTVWDGFLKVLPARKQLKLFNALECSFIPAQPQALLAVPWIKK